MKEFKLDNEPKIASGFKVPDAYFDDFQSKVIQQLPQKKISVFALSSYNKNWYYAVAAILLVALSITVVNNFNVINSSNVDEASLENYLINHSEISDDDLAEVLNIKELQQMKIDMVIDDKDLEDILTSNSNFEEYLIN